MRRIAMGCLVSCAFVLSGWLTAIASSSGEIATVPPFTQVATYAGPAPSTQLLRLVVHLAYPQPKAVARFVKAVNDPSSSFYGAYLTPAQFTAQFGPSGHSYSTVEYAITNAGGSIFATYTNLKTLDVLATVEQADLLFNTTINQYVYNGVTYYANGGPVYAPSALQGIVMAVSGFTNFAQKVAQPPGSTSGGYGPSDIQRAYDEPIRTQPSINGSGVTIAIDTAYDYLDSDLLSFLGYYGIARTGAIARVPVLDPVNQGLPPPPQSDETTLDVEQVAANAPGANVEVYEAADTLNPTFDDMYALTVADQRVDIVTTSFGQCEAAADPHELAADNDLFEQGAAEGQTWFAADGDLGSRDCGMNDPPFGLPGFSNPITVDFPASSPYVAAVGGTTLTMGMRPRGIHINRREEAAWSGSGGGVSAFFARPWYQKGVDRLALRGARNVPDVALDADPNTPYALYWLGTFALASGGTSAAAPNLAAMQAQFDQYSGRRLGMAHGALYGGLQRGGYPGSAWHDVQRGSNGDYAAHAGYDNVTGVGSLDALNYMQRMQQPRYARRL